MSKSKDSGFRSQDSGFRIQDSGFRSQESGVRSQELMNHVSLTGPEGYRNEEHEGRRKKEGRLYKILNFYD
jgi:hypothetical protein